VYPLVESKVLPSVTRFNPVIGREQPFIELQALADFQHLHISIAGIASIYGSRADIIAQRMELLEIEPSCDRGSRPGRYYRRSDLDKFTFGRVAA